MTILIITNYYPPYHKGGYEVSCKDIGDYLSKQHTVYILTGNYNASPLSTLPENLQNGEVIRILYYIDYLKGGYKQKHNVEIFNHKITKELIQRVNPDLIYLWNQQGVSMAPLFASQNSKIPLVFDFGDFWYRLYMQNALSDKIKRIIKHILPFTVSGKPVWNNLICVSNWMAEDIRNELHPKKLSVIPRGVAVHKIGQCEKDKAKLKLMYAGRIDKKKGLHLCLEALHILDGEDYEFNVFGSGDEEYLEFCRTLVTKYNLTEYVHFKGNSENLYKEYASHHILLMPTMATETFGRVVIEAMAHEMIVIASNKYGPAEIINSGKDGYLITPGKSQEIAEIITMLKGNVDKMNSIAKNAKIKVIENYDLDIVNKLREKVLQEEVKNHA
ncbi:MAG: glycosyltransferase [Candidatus Cloacimonetes bacterium]|nr:glycosyltransferase [Candidatus Cloacimonadota bacterium]